MSYPPTPEPDGSYPPPADPPVPAYQPPPPNDAHQYGYGTPPAQSYDYGTPQPQGYGTPQPQGYDYGYPGSPYSYPNPPYAPGRPTDGMAIASLIVSCAGVLGLCAWGIGGLLGILGAIFGHVAWRRIRRSGAGGSGLALAGILVGWTITVIGAICLAAVILLVVMDPSTY